MRLHRFFAAAMGAAGLWAVLAPAHAAVYITEFMASNQSTLEDDDGDRPDWLELHNSGPGDVNLNGWSLTDDTLIAEKWAFPSITLRAGNYLVVFASGKNRVDPARPLHTNFEIAAEGGYLALYPPGSEAPATEFSPYPPQFEDYSYGLSMNGDFATLIGSGAAARALVPSDNTLGSTWTQATFNDSAWRSGATGMGYDRATDYLGDIDIDFRAEMDGVASTAYLRVPFTVADPSGFNAFFLRMKYDDGFIAYINGVRVASRNAPTSPTWNSNATAQHDDPLALVFEDIPLDEATPAQMANLLRSGTNVLAIHGLNVNSTSSDFLILPELDAASSGALDPAVREFFPKSSPGFGNLGGFPAVAPSPQFSRSGGIFTGSLSLSLSTPGGAGAIRYTTNGSEPTEASTAYSSALSINGSTLVRARTFAPGMAPSPIVHQGFIGLAADVQSFSSNLPIILIDNFGRGSFPGDPYIPAFMAIFEPSGGRSRLNSTPALQTRVGIKTRGSSTAGQPKPNYAMESWDQYNQDVDIEPLGLPKESDWVLHAPYNFDPLLIRNPFIFEMSNLIGTYATRWRSVEVFVNTGGGSLANADYFGVYNFLEKIKRGPDRVDVEKLTAAQNSAPEVSGGYMAKIDRLDPGDSGFSAGGQRLGFVYPKEDLVTSQQTSYFSSTINEFVNVLNGASYRDPVNGYRKYIDVPGWIDHHILNVYSKNVDALRLSTYMYKGRNKKLIMGPIWDFDRSMQSTDGRDDSPNTWNGTGDGTQYFTYPWWSRLFTDVDFWQAWIDRWQELRRSVFATGTVNSLIDAMTGELTEAQARDFAKWGQSKRGGWTGEINLLKTWLSQRAAWIDGRFVAAPSFSSGGRPITPGFEITMTGPAGATIYYTLDGRDPRLPGGGVAGYAETYSGAVTLLENSRVFARARGTRIEGSEWSGPRAETFVVETPRLVVSEMMFHPVEVPGGSPYNTQDFEFIELMNAGEVPLDLAGAGFTAGIRFTFPAGAAPLNPGDYVVLVKSRPAFDELYDSNGIRIDGEYDGNLSNGGEVLTLVGPLKEPILSFAFSDLWYPTTDGQGETLNIVDPTAALSSWGEKESWLPSSVFGGTPGEPDPGIFNPGGRQRPGDSNQDGRLDLSDAVSLLRRLFVDGALPLPCDGAGLADGGNRFIFDVNDDEAVNVADVLALLNFLFKEGPAPASGLTCQRIEGCPSACGF